MRLEKEIIKQGYWWLPDEPANQLFGTLKIQIDGTVSLDINGFLRSPYGTFGSYTVFEYEKILGTTEDGKSIILLNCFETSSSMRLGAGISTTSINSKFAFIGNGITNIENLEFSKLVFSFEGLSEWLNISGLTIEHKPDLEKGEIKYENPESFSYILEDIGKFSFEFVTKLNTLTRHLTEIKITQEEFITLELDNSLQIFDIVKKINRIVKFFCFAIDRTVSLKFLNVIYTDGEQLEHLDVYYRSLPFSEKPANIDIHLMLFHFSMIYKDFEKLLTSWLKQYDFLEPTFNLYFFTIQSIKNLESRFLFLAQALETFHRRTCDETLFNKEDYERFSEKLSEVVEDENKDFQEWIQNKLRYGNELFLRKRLKKLISPFENLYGSAKDRKLFISQFLDTRNYLTHYDKSLENKVCKGENLLNLGRKSEALLQLHLLMLIEFPKSLFEEVFTKGIFEKIKYSQRLL